MLNILIVGDDLKKCKEIINKISKLNLKIYKIANSENETLKILKEDVIDIIIMYINEKEWEIKLFNKINIYKNLILISSNDELIEFFKSLDYSNIIYNIKNLDDLKYNLQNTIYKMKKLEKLINDKINLELEYLHFNFSHKGTTYLRESIYQIYIRNNKKFNLTKDIYIVVAKKYDTSINNIKCDIFQACCNSYYECEEQVMKKYLNKSCIEKPTTKDFIEAILKRI